MIKMRLICFLLILLAFPTSGQDYSPNTPRILLAQIAKSKPDTSRIELELRLARYYIFKPGYFKIDKDTALTYLDDAYKLSTSLGLKKWQNETILLKGTCYLQIDDVTHGVPLFMQIISYYQKKNDKAGEAATWASFGNSYSRNAILLEKKIDCYRMAHALYQQLRLSSNEFEAAKNIADMHMIQGKYDLAERELLQLIAEMKAISFKNLHYTYDLLASVNKLKGDLHKELLYKMKVVSSMEETGDYSHATYFYYNLATTYFDLGFFDKSLTYYYKTLPYSIKEQNFGRYYELLRDIVKALIAEGKTREALIFLKKKTKEIPPADFKQQEWMDAAFGNCYQELHRYAEAEKYYLNMIRLADIDYRNQGYEDFFNNYSIVSNFYVGTGQYHKANFYLSKLLNAPSKLMRPSVMSRVQLMQFKVDSASGRMTSAIRHYQLHKKINDSLFNATNKKLLEEVQLRYESEQQSKNIQLLKKQSLLEQNQVDRTKAIKNVFLGGVLMLTALLGLSYNRYRLKRRSNFKLQEQQKIITDKNTELEKLLRDNEWLLKEVHHRVKNNLQMVMSLLSSQSSYLKDTVALNAVRDGRHRIQAMSLIHQKLYNSNNVSIIDMPEYITELLDYLIESFEARKTIFFDVDVDSVSLDVLQAVPVGLILNEAITNAIKYAFTDAHENVLTVRLKTEPSNHILLHISDNGQGLPQDFNVQKPNSFGMKLMRGLTEDLGGTFSITCDHGTIVTVMFPKSGVPSKSN